MRRRVPCINHALSRSVGRICVFGRRSSSCIPDAYLLHQGRDTLDAEAAVAHDRVAGGSPAPKTKEAAQRPRLIAHAKSAARDPLNIKWAANARIRPPFGCGAWHWHFVALLCAARVCDEPTNFSPGHRENAFFRKFAELNFDDKKYMQTLLFCAPI